MASKEEPKMMKPMIVRMLGTNADEGREILSNSDLEITLVNTLDEAATAINKIK